MEISERLRTVASFVKTSRSIADIGTDHGYIPIYLYKGGIIDRAIACDINKGPVERAKNNINMYHLSDKIETRLGNGMRVISAGETDGAVIAGMGGMLIKDILDYDREKTQSFKELVLQPQSDIDKVRKYLHSIGFKIDDEKMLFEDGIYYTVIRAVHGNERYDSEEDYLFGKINIDDKSPVLKKYIEKTMEKNNTVIEKLKQAATNGSMERLAELENLQEICREVYKCL